MNQVKFIQTADARDSIRSRLTSFTDQQRDILFDIGSHSRGASQVADLFTNKSQQDEIEQIEWATDVLRTFATERARPT